MHKAESPRKRKRKRKNRQVDREEQERRRYSLPSSSPISSLLLPARKQVGWGVCVVFRASRVACCYAATYAAMLLAARLFFLYCFKLKMPGQRLLPAAMYALLVVKYLVGHVEMEM